MIHLHKKANFRIAAGAHAFGLAIFLITWMAVSAAAESSSPIPRTILALYDGKEDSDARGTQIHLRAEMPLNHLGLTVRYHDIHQKLPPVESLSDVRGVLTWFVNDEMPDPLEFVRWAEAAMDKGIRFVVMGEPGIHKNLEGRLTPLIVINRYLGKLGLQARRRSKIATFDVSLSHKNPQMVEFEHKYQGILPSFMQVQTTDESMISHLVASWGENPKRKSDLVVTGPQGGYVAQGYAVYQLEDFQKWYLNPFEFFRLAFATDAIPKPDTTTLSGRRIYYSHIDGDGWRNITQIERYKETRVSSAEVIFKEVLQRFPNFPVTVAPIVADLDFQWHGTPEMLSLAKRIFSLPQVEAASHTLSHPFNWKYFESYRPGNEWRTYLRKQKFGDRSVLKRYKPFLDPEDKNNVDPPDLVEYETPRAHGNFPFDLEKEISGSIEFINRLLPPGKRVRLYQWSGDCWVFPAALKKARDRKVFSINGGDSRFDSEFPSNLWVSPIGAQVGDQVQIYASASNENTYTDLWSDRFYGFKNLQWTIKNTETPRRVKPINVYYHMFSGEKEASLKALVENIRFAETQEIAPITTSHYAGIAQGFFSARFISLGPKTWRIENRGNLQTIRFDRAAALAADLENSKGVIGQRHYQGSLYIALDAAESSPVIALRGHPVDKGIPDSDRPYLIEGRWNVWDVQATDANQIVFTAQGFGGGSLTWKVPGPGHYVAQLSDKNEVKQRIKASADEKGILKLNFGAEALNPVRITVTRVEEIL